MYNLLYTIDTRKLPYLCDAIAIRFEQLGYEIKDIGAIREKGLWFDLETKQQLIPENLEFTPTGGRNVNDDDMSDWDDVDLGHFFQAENFKFRKPKKIIKLTKSYNAVVEHDKVKVGCKEISFATVKEIYNAVIEMEKENEHA